MGVLTEANYLSRKAKLQEHLAAAKRAHEDTAFRLEMGTSTSEELATAQQALIELSGRLTGLDSAWRRTQAELAEQALANDAVARREAVASIHALLKERHKIAGKMQKAAQALADVRSEMVEVSRKIVELAAPHRRFVTGEMEMLRGALDPNWCIPAPLVAGILYAGGWDFTGVDLHSVRIDAQTQTVPDRIEALNADIRRRVAGIADADPSTAVEELAA